MGAIIVDPPALEATLGPLIESTMAEEEVPGVQVALVADGRTVWSRGFGFADLEAQRHVDTDTVFRAASVSKLFTALLMMQQIEAKRIGLDDDVNRYLAPPRRIRDAQGNEAPVSVRQLLSHSSGLPVSWGSWAQHRYNIFGGPPPRLDDDLASGLTLIHRPGQTIVYANAGFWLLGWLAGHLVGKPFEEAVREAVLVPTGMASSDFEPLRRLTSRQAVPYRGTTGHFKPAFGPRALAVNPAASLLTTAEDLTRFARMVLAGGLIDGQRLLAPQTLAEMSRLQVRQDPALDTGFGLGFMVGTHRGRPMIRHDGWDPGVSTRLAILPAESIAVAVLANASSRAATHRIAGLVVDAVLGELPPTAEHDVQAASGAPLARYAGRYRAVDSAPPRLSFVESLMQVALRPEKGILAATGFGLAGTRGLVPTANEEVFMLRGGPWDGERAVFRAGPDGAMDLYFDIVHLRRIPWYAATPVLLLGAAAAVLAASSGLLWRISRQRRKRRLLPNQRRLRQRPAMTSFGTLKLHSC
jgi:CubicO group peptidase (beta-lactamase class C family)